LEGEAYFDVAEDGRPFQVITSQGEVTVLGTAFGISSYTTVP
ncbi:MAG TPA: iron dicitrate transport regulator FecR, partial [Odoribacter splanchnicus]|nr:iron dicitrate transport regulator FecR [Odoribacter splanchnicus]